MEQESAISLTDVDKSVLNDKTNQLVIKRELLETLENPNNEETINDDIEIQVTSLKDEIGNLEEEILDISEKINDNKIKESEKEKIEYQISQNRMQLDNIQNEISVIQNQISGSSNESDKVLVQLISSLGSM